MDYKELIRDVPDYPKKGILFKDLTTLWKDGNAFKKSAEDLADYYKGKNISKVVGIESRGFIIGSALAYILNIGFVPVRKEGKLPAEVIKKTYELEYGTDTLVIHKDAISQGEKVIIVDDLLATGGTCQAVTSLVEELGGVVEGVGFIVELSFLEGRKKLEQYDIKTLITY